MSATRFPLRDGGDQGSNNNSPRKFHPVPLAYVSYERKTPEEQALEAQNPTAVKCPAKSPLFIQHGLFGCKENWKKIGKEVNFISKRAVIAVDGRNHGESPQSNEMSIGLMAKDIQRLYQHLNYDKISFMGHSMGGRIGMILAMMYPRILDKLVVVDSSPLPCEKIGTRYQALRQAAAIMKRMEPELRECAGYTRGVVAAKALEPILPDKTDVARILSNLTPPSKTNGNGNGVGSTTEDVKLEPIWKVNLDAFLANPNLVDFPAFDESNAYFGKTLFIAGTNSQYVKEENADEIRKLFPNAKFAWIKDAGHYVHVEKHQEFMQELVKFMDDKNGAPPPPKEDHGTKKEE